MTEATDNTKEIITEFIREEYFTDDPQMLTGQTRLLSERIIDSVSVMVLVQFLEERFGFEFEPHEVDTENLDTIDLITEFVKRRMA